MFSDKKQFPYSLLLPRGDPKLDLQNFSDFRRLMLFRRESKLMQTFSTFLRKGYVKMATGYTSLDPSHV